MIEPAVALAHGMSGNAAGAEEALRRANELRHPAIRIQEPLVALAEAWAAAAAGAISLAVKHARRAAGLAGRSGQYAVEVLARHAAVEFGDRAQLACLAELARHVEGPRAPAAAVHVRALRDGAPTALLLASEQLAAAGLLLPAAEAAAQAAVSGDPRDPLERCPGAHTPALVAAAHPLPITDWEREVATLTVGLSNREIAKRLGVSVRTVEGHIYHACVKLGVRDRTALAHMVAGSG